MDGMTSPTDSLLQPQGQNLNAFCAVFLAIFTITAFTANIFLIVTIGSSYRLRNYVINYFILNLCIVNLVDATVNMVLTLLFITMCHPGQCEWRLGQALCNFNAFTMQLVGIETVFALCLLATDRAVALLNMNRYKQRLTPFRILVAIVGCWIVGLCFSLPILTGSVPSAPFEARYFCSVADNVPVGYPAAVIVFCYALPFLVILAAFGVVYHRAHIERLMRKAMRPDLHYTDREHIIDTRRFQDYLILAKFIVALFFIFFIFQGPYILLNFIEQIANSHEVNGTINGSGFGTAFAIAHDSETAITWIKFLFPVLLPFIVFGCCRDIWRKFLDLVCCKRTSVIKRRIRTSANGNCDCDDVAVVNARVPTLVATTDGLHLEQVQTDAHGNVISEELKFADHPPRAGKSKRFGVGGGETTSDYDSGSDEDDEDGNSDPLNVSNGQTKEQRQRSGKLKTQIIAGNIQKTELEVEVFPRTKRIRSESGLVLQRLEAPNRRPNSATKIHSLLGSTASAVESSGKTLGAVETVHQHKRTLSDGSVNSTKHHEPAQLEVLLKPADLNTQLKHLDPQGNHDTAECVEDTRGTRSASAKSTNALSQQHYSLDLAEATHDNERPNTAPTHDNLKPDNLDDKVLKQADNTPHNLEDRSFSPLPTTSSSALMTIKQLFPAVPYPAATQSGQELYREFINESSAGTSILDRSSTDARSRRNRHKHRNNNQNKHNSRYPNLPTSAELRDIKHLPHLQLLNSRAPSAELAKTEAKDEPRPPSFEESGVVADLSRSGSGDSDTRELLHRDTQTQMSRFLSRPSSIKIPGLGGYKHMLTDNASSATFTDLRSTPAPATAKSSHDPPPSASSLQGSGYRKWSYLLGLGSSRVDAQKQHRPVQSAGAVDGQKKTPEAFVTHHVISSHVTFSAAQRRQRYTPSSSMSTPTAFADELRATTRESSVVTM